MKGRSLFATLLAELVAFIIPRFLLRVSSRTNTFPSPPRPPPRPALPVRNEAKMKLALPLKGTIKTVFRLFPRLSRAGMSVSCTINFSPLLHAPLITLPASVSRAIFLVFEFPRFFGALPLVSQCSNFRENLERAAAVSLDSRFSVDSHISLSCLADLLFTCSFPRSLLPLDNPKGNFPRDGNLICRFPFQ